MPVPRRPSETRESEPAKLADNRLDAYLACLWAWRLEDGEAREFDGDGGGASFTQRHRGLDPPPAPGENKIAPATICPLPLLFKYPAKPLTTTLP